VSADASAKWQTIQAGCPEAGCGYTYYRLELGVVALEVQHASHRAPKVSWYWEVKVFGRPQLGDRIDEWWYPTFEAAQDAAEAWASAEFEDGLRRLKG